MDDISDQPRNRWRAGVPWLVVATTAATGLWMASLTGTGAPDYIAIPATAEAAAVYTVNRKVTDLPERENLSTPEAAYATINRLSASGEQAFWRRVSAPRLEERLPSGSGKRAVSAKAARSWLEAEILEVHVWEKTNAVVIARTPDVGQGRVWDLRWLSKLNDQWLNEGNDGAASLEQARATVARGRAFREARRLREARPPVADPEKHLRPFVEFLRREAADPHAFLLQALARHDLVILGEVHNRQRYWAFNTALARSPAFAENVGVVYLELPINDQPLMDRFLAAPKYDPTPVIDILRDLFEFGWPDQPTVDFCRTIWEINQSLPKERRIRIGLVDMARPWKEIQRRQDWAKHDVDRDEFMAAQIGRDRREHPQDPRHALFIVGYMHAMKNLRHPGGEPRASAGWHLCQAFGGTNLFAVFPHSPVMANRGGVDGRLALGLFETAFAALTNRPIAFPLGHGPFGELLFDASLDFPTMDSYRAGYDAFLYLGPLEDEIVSPLIPGFYTDDFAREVDRRCRLMNGRGLQDDPAIGEVSGAAITRMREVWWGQPRREWRALGPLDAWHHGSDWKRRLSEDRHRNVLQDTSAIKREAGRLFDAIRKADYRQPQNWRAFPSPEVEYTVHSDAPGWVLWVCQHFRTNPIVRVELGEVLLQADRRPAVPYKVTLKNDTSLEGTLPFEWRSGSQRWEALEGLDWHRRP